MKVPFLELFADETKRGRKLQTNGYLSKGKHPIIDQGHKQVAGYTDLEEGLFSDVPVIIFGDHTRVVKYVDQPFFLGADGTKILQPRRDDVNPRYLYHYLASTTIPNTGYNRHFKWLKVLVFNLPSLPEQRHIADILDKADALITNYRRQLSLLDALIQSRFHELFGDVIRNDRSWPTKRMAEVVSCPAYEGEINQQDGKVWLLNLDKVEAESGKVLQKEYVPKHAIGVSTVTFSADSVLYSKLRPYLNKVVEPDTSGYATSELIPLSPDTQRLHKTYLAALLRSKSFVSFISSRVAGAKMPRVQMKDFWNFPIPLPPLATQLRFVDFVASLKQSRSLFLETRLSNARMLKASLTQRYFNAEESVNE